MDETLHKAAPRRVDAFDGPWFITRNYLTGAAVGAGFTTLFLIADIGRLRTLALGGEPQWLAVALLAGAMALTFAALFTAAAIMLTFRN